MVMIAGNLTMNTSGGELLGTVQAVATEVSDSLSGRCNNMSFPTSRTLAHQDSSVQLTPLQFTLRGCQGQCSTQTLNTSHVVVDPHNEGWQEGRIGHFVPPGKLFLIIFASCVKSQYLLFNFHQLFLGFRNIFSRLFHREILSSF